ncbi:hypothetical protein GXM_09081 [Nostoc sphaeroides CCNUC1]|uniref:Uncharacterized protein n=1 Tax=Nostoc sphaeroides CCNUC1 TaxID=2653204 RepID=A0A5P8WFH5_9NOSO|nr:hypothetical protein GXM_09081 [Nostoc sphaeroides CCNUC1]
MSTTGYAYACGRVHRRDELSALAKSGSKPSQNNSKFKIINFIINTPRINAGA